MTRPIVGSTTVALTGARVLLDRAWRDDATVLIEGGQVRDVVDRAPPGALRLPEGSLLAPGFIDVQVNGGGGVLLNDDPSEAAMARIAAAHRRFGTTALLPTLITDTPERMRASCAAARGLPADGPVIGLHLEGPFLSPSRPGVHDPRHLRAIEDDDVRLIGGLAASRPDLRVVLTVAPECVPDAALRALDAAGVILSAGHTEAAPERIAAAFEAGLRGYTHLFNAMPPIAGRAPGPVGAALTDPRGWCGIIADGIHVAPALLRLALRARPADTVFLVTDAMPPTGTADRAFDLGGRRIHRRNGRLETADGVLAGADLDMVGAVRNAVALLGVDLATALRMASAVPAAFLKDDRRGRIALGARADLVLLAPDLTVLGTWLGGDWQNATVCDNDSR